MRVYANSARPTGCDRSAPPRLSSSALVQRSTVLVLLLLVTGVLFSALCLPDEWHAATLVVNERVCARAGGPPARPPHLTCTCSHVRCTHRYSSAVLSHCTTRGPVPMYCTLVLCLYHSLTTGRRVRCVSSCAPESTHSTPLPHCPSRILIGSLPLVPCPCRSLTLEPPFGTLPIHPPLQRNRNPYICCKCVQ